MVTHLKTPGSLGNIAAVDADLAMAVARASAAIDRDLFFVAIPGTEIERAGEKLGLRVVREAYADRTYDDDGNLTSRKTTGAVIHDPEIDCRRVLRMPEDGALTSVNGKRIPVRIDTICVHGDNQAAVGMARAIRRSEEHTSELQSLMRNSYAVFCLK